MSHSASSVADPQGYVYEAFLSFRGPDTRSGFTDHLYTRLTSAGIHAFIDNEELRVGEDIGGNLLEAITQSKICIPIFSTDYVSSKWCLMEAAHMVICRNTRNQLILPIFYDVTPHQVKHQSGTYDEAFKRHSDRYDGKTVQEWRNALVEIGALKGWELQKDADRREGALVEMVVSRVWRELKKAYLVIKDTIIGIEDSMGEVMGKLQVGSTDVRVVGIYGISGIGKTTLAKIVYNQLLKHFEYSSFLKDICEMSSQPRGLEKLQTQLVSNILRSKDLQHEFANVDEGIKVLRERFRDKKVLILLDDVDRKDQIDALAADLNWFAGGSRIIITTKNKGVLDVSQVKVTHEVRPMRFNESCFLFNMHAFKGELPAADYVDLSEEIVKTTGGLPLALEIIGSFLSSINHRESWEEVLGDLQNCPHKDVQAKLRISYDALGFKQKEIFLDIACFFIGTDKRIAEYMWKERGLSPNLGVDILLQRCLIKVEKYDEFWMHEQLRDLGRAIIRNENISKPHKRSRLWSSDDVRHALKKRKGSGKIEAIQFDDGIKSKDYCLTSEHPMVLPNIRFLKLVGDEFASCIQCGDILSWLQWHYCTAMKCSLVLDNLVILDLSRSYIRDDWWGWSSGQLGIKLKVLLLESCTELHKTPDLSKFQTLERLSFEGCTKLYEVDPSIGKLKNLISLNLSYCRYIRELPDLGGLKKLQFLSMSNCASLVQIPPSIGQLTSLLELSLGHSKVSALPDSIQTLVKLKCLFLNGCLFLRKLPDSIGQLMSLEKLLLTRSGVHTLPDSIGNLTNLRMLDVSYSEIMNLPSTLGMLEKLEVINAMACMNLRGDISIDLGSLCCLTTLNLVYCHPLQALPELPTSLQCLSVSGRPLKAFPDLSFHTKLLTLGLDGCFKLERIPGLGNLTSLKSLTVTWCEKLTTLDGLEKLERIEELQISWCNLQSTPNLSALKMLWYLSFEWCEKLLMVEGLGELESLEYLNMEGCKAIENLPNLSKLRKLKELNLVGCWRLRGVHGLEVLKSLYRVDVSSTQSYRTKKWPHIPDNVQSALTYRQQYGLGNNLPECNARGMIRLRIRQEYLIWSLYHNEDIRDTNLYTIAQELYAKNITGDWNGWSFMKKSIHLEAIILASCQRLTRTPDFSTFPKLHTLIIEECTSLNHIDPSIGSLKYLKFLSVKGCLRLEVLPPELISLQLLAMHLDGTCVTEIPAFNDPTRLERLSLHGCKSLRRLPGSIERFRSLKVLDLSHTSIHALPDSIGELGNLEVLDLSGSSIEYLPRTLGKLEKLQDINVSYCGNLNGEIILDPMRLFSLRAFISDGTDITLPPTVSEFQQDQH